jgi:hypothetical protein
MYSGPKKTEALVKQSLLLCTPETETLHAALLDLEMDFSNQKIETLSKKEIFPDQMRKTPWRKYRVRSPLFVWAPCAQLYSLAETPPFPRIWAHIRGRYWSAKIEDISL